MTTLSRARVRVAVDLVGWNSLTDALTGQSPVIPRGNIAQVEVGIFNNTTILDSFTGIESVTIEIRASDAPSAPAFVTKTVLAAALTACDASAWSAGTGQHALIELSDTETDLPAHGDGVSYWFVVGAMLADGPVALDKGVLKIVADGYGGASGSGAYPTLAEADARYMRRGIPNGSFRTDPNGQHIQLYNPTTAKWHSIGCDGPAGAVGITVEQQGEA